MSDDDSSLYLAADGPLPYRMPPNAHQVFDGAHWVPYSDELERLRAATSRVRELAERWANRSTEEGGNAVVDTIVAGVAQDVLRALDGER